MLRYINLFLRNISEYNPATEFLSQAVNRTVILKME